MSRLINKIILHCSDSNIKAHDDIEVIDEWHKARDFRYRLPSGKVIHVGYHYFIKSDGTVQTGRPEEGVGAHCYGENKHSIGICLHGRNKEDFTDAQFKALATLVQGLVQRYPEATIHGHNEFANKTCPVYDVDDFIENYMATIENIDVNG